MAARNTSMASLWKASPHGARWRRPHRRSQADLWGLNVALPWRDEFQKRFSDSDRSASVIASNQAPRYYGCRYAEMKTLKAFVAKSFHAADRPKTERIESFLSRFEKLGFIWGTAEAAEVESVSAKVRGLIDEADIFVGIFTRRAPLCADGGRFRRIVDIVRGQSTDDRWSAPPWVLQESGYALKAEKRLILFVEIGVDLGALQGDLEYIPFDPLRPEAALEKAHEMLSDLIARNARLTTEVVTNRAEVESNIVEPAGADPPTNPPEQPAAFVVADEEHTVAKAFVALRESLRDRDFDAARRAYQSGLDIVAATRPEALLVWKVHYNGSIYRLGSEDGLGELRRLQAEHPDDPLASATIGGALRSFRQYDQAAHEYFAASEIATGRDRVGYFIEAVECLRAVKKPAEAKQRVQDLLDSHSSLPPESRIRILKLLYSIYLDLGQKDYAVAVGELVLSENPGDAGFRSGLAYEYLDHQSKCSVYHYEIACRSDPKDQEVNWINNLGYAYSLMELPIHAARQYTACRDLSMPRGTKNLADLLLESGMADAATEMLRAAKDWDDPESLIPQGLASIYERTAAEDEKRVKALEAVVRHQEFFVSMGAALLERVPQGIDGVWKFPFGELELKLRGNALSGSGEAVAPENS